MEEIGRRVGSDTRRARTREGASGHWQLPVGYMEDVVEEASEGYGRRHEELESDQSHDVLHGY